MRTSLNRPKRGEMILRHVLRESQGKGYTKQLAFPITFVGQMAQPEYVITLHSDKRQYISIAQTCLVLGLNRQRIFQFLKRGELTSTFIPRTSTRIIPLDEVRAFARKKRPTGRPPTKKKAAKKAIKKNRPKI